MAALVLALLFGRLQTEGCQRIASIAASPLFDSVTASSSVVLGVGCAPLPSAGTTSRPANWIKPQPTGRLGEAPTEDSWLHDGAAVRRDQSRLVGLYGRRSGFGP